MIEFASALPSSTSYPLGRIIAHESFPGDNVPEPRESEEEIVFRGRPASLITRQDPPRKFLGSPYFVYRVVFEESGKSYTLTYCVNQDTDGLPPMVKRYFETFQVLGQIRKDENRNSEKNVTPRLEEAQQASPGQSAAANAA